MTLARPIVEVPHHEDGPRVSHEDLLARSHTLDVRAEGLRDITVLVVPMKKCGMKHLGSMNYPWVHLDAERYMVEMDPAQPGGWDD